MREDEILEMQKREALVKGMFRDDNMGYSPIVIKAAQAGSLETLVMEAERIIGNQFKVQVVSTGVGPITEKDLNEAS
jgi:translation initiation factor IF-2